MVTTKSLHTLNARGHLMLEVVRQQFSLTPERMQLEIQAIRQDVEDALALKGIKYEELRNALVPRRDRREIALVFDTLAIESDWYGFTVFERLLPLFDKKSSHSVLVGDYLDSGGMDQASLHRAMSGAVKLNREVHFRHSTQFFIVYINNLTDEMVTRFNEGFAGWAGYIGYADTTYHSLFKWLLSTMLMNVFLKHRSIILQGHEDDVPNTVDSNMCGYPFEAFGYVNRSIQDYLNGIMLSYKIEAPVFPGSGTDIEFSLNAVSSTPLPLETFSVRVDEAKATYIKTLKAGSAESAGLEAVSAQELSTLITARISQSYIYNLVYDAEHKVTRFNVMIELPRGPTRLLAALAYEPQHKVLRLLTLF
jgi:hypothetical protein